jgi:hypothetical protein
MSAVAVAPSTTSAQSRHSGVAHARGSVSATVYADVTALDFRAIAVVLTARASLALVCRKTVNMALRSSSTGTQRAAGVKRAASRLVLTAGHVLTATGAHAGRCNPEASAPASTSVDSRKFVAAASATTVSSAVRVVAAKGIRSALHATARATSRAVLPKSFRSTARVQATASAVTAGTKAARSAVALRAVALGSLTGAKLATALVWDTSCGAASVSSVHAGRCVSTLTAGHSVVVLTIPWRDIRIAGEAWVLVPDNVMDVAVDDGVATVPLDGADAHIAVDDADAVVTLTDPEVVVHA